MHILVILTEFINEIESHIDSVNLLNVSISMHPVGIEPTNLLIIPNHPNL